MSAVQLTEPEREALAPCGPGCIYCQRELPGVVERIITDRLVAEQERIAQAIESEREAGHWPRVLGFADGLSRAARIARAGGVS